MKIRKNKGITLVALVITIIILLILAGVTIIQLTGNGLFEKAKLAKEKQENAQELENTILADYEGKIDEYVNGSREQITINKEEYEQLLSRVEALENNSSSNVGEIHTTTFSNVNVITNTTEGNIIASITLPAGKYVLVGHAVYPGNDLRYWISLGNANTSAYDNNGHVGMNVSSIVEISQETTFNMKVYVSKSVTLSYGSIRAIKIGD